MPTTAGSFQRHSRKDKKVLFSTTAFYPGDLVMNGIVSPFKVCNITCLGLPTLPVGSVSARELRKRPNTRHNSKAFASYDSILLAFFSLAIMCQVDRIVFACGCEKTLDLDGVAIRCEFAKLKGMDCPSFQLTESLKHSELNCLGHS